MNWIQELDSAKPTILTGEWFKAESAWARLNKEEYTANELEAWIKLQVEVLEGTRSDKFKSGLRGSAIQEMYFFPDASR